MQIRTNRGRMIRLASLMILAAPAACDGPADDDDTTAGDDDTGDDDSGPDGFTEGDPIETVLVADSQNGFWEWVDAAVLDDGTGVLVGVGGVGVADPVSHEMIHERHSTRAFRVAAHGQRAVVATREGAVEILDLSTPTAPQVTGSYSAPGYHEDVAISGDRVLVGWHDSGGILLDHQGTPVTNLPADDAFAVGLSDNLALLTDDHDLVLFDVSQDGSAVELDRVDLGGAGRDIDFDG